MSEIVFWSTAPQTATFPFLHFLALFFLSRLLMEVFSPTFSGSPQFLQIFYSSPFISLVLLSFYSFHFSLLSPDLPVLLTLSCLPFIPTAHFSPLPLISSCSILIWILRASVLGAKEEGGNKGGVLISKVCKQRPSSNC